MCVQTDFSAPAQALLELLHDFYAVTLSDAVLLSEWPAAELERAASELLAAEQLQLSYTEQGEPCFERM